MLHGLGRLTEASTAFAKAEALQAENDPESPRLYKMRGFGYAQLLLERACRPDQWRELLVRGRYALKIGESYRYLFALALDNCTIGLSLSALGESAEAAAALDLAVSNMQGAGTVNFQPIPNLARAHHRRTVGDHVGAWADHNVAHRIAENCGMRTYLADAALLAGQLCLDQGNAPDAAAHHALAAEIIHADGYGRRLAELHLLDARLHHRQHDPAAACAALHDAETRIRAIGQWGIWRDLVKTATEIGLLVSETCPAESEP